ncbi:nucleotidyltransferase family protein [Paucibacter sp. APW11]|uniref:Nucleotidyltransferase family protein n=1 Tax=Roseateles aquae TaxID=3077235 RepID=A0ABU3P810_9BURK|nr:nucleotidyltransferase family protein [Paucibacter sp. APW11]MDT8998709.1 nucleotidyltransferase family protein [Paucibacter sp. APW11]
MDMRRLAVVVLAAGRGMRFRGAGHKLVQGLGQTSVLGSTLANALETGLRVVVVCSEALAPSVREMIAASDVVVLPERGLQGQVLPVGMGHSIAAGVSASGDADGWLILPGDMPMVRARSMRAVGEALLQSPVAFAQYRGLRGHPVGFAAELYSDLIELQGDEGARRLIARYPSAGVELDDAGVLVDVDTVEDLHKLRAQLQPQL